MSQDLEALKRTSTGHALLKAARLFNERALAEVQAAGHPDVRASHLTLMPHLDLTGTRLTELAERMGITKQAVGQLVTEVEALGYVERRPDPVDGRAKLVCFTDRGRRSMLDGMAAIGRVEAEVRAAVGAEPMDALRAGLSAVIDALQPRPAG